MQVRSEVGIKPHHYMSAGFQDRMYAVGCSIGPVTQYQFSLLYRVSSQFLAAGVIG